MVKMSMQLGPNFALIYIGIQDNSSALKAQLDQQKSVVDNLFSNTRVGCFLWPNLPQLLFIDSLYIFYVLITSCVLVIASLDAIV